MKEMISRRSFLHVMGLGFGAAMLTACKTCLLYTSDAADD